MGNEEGNSKKQNAPPQVLKQKKPEEEEEEEEEEEKQQPPPLHQQKQQKPLPKQPPTQISSKAPRSPPRITGPRVEKSANPVPSSLQVIIVGLDNAGKSSILSHIKADQVSPNVVPTAGFKIEKFMRGKTEMTVYDMAGSSAYRNLWDEHLKGCQVMIFVVDSSDRFRLVVVREELVTLMEQPDMNSVPLLVFANKNDLPNALNYSKVSEQLGLEDIVDRSWNIVSSSAKTGTGITEGVEWILRNYKKDGF